MPWPNLRWVATADLIAMYAYLKVIPAVKNMIPPDQKGPLAAAMPVPMPTSYNEGAVTRPLPPELDAMMNPIQDPGYVQRGLAISPVPYTLPASPSQIGLLGRGIYVVNAALCSGCHTNPDRDPMTLAVNTTQYLSGGHVFNIPPFAAPLFKIVRSMSADLEGATNGTIANGTIDFQKFMGIVTQGMHVEDPNPTPIAFPMPWPYFKNLTLGDMEAIFTFLQAVPNPIGANDKATQTPARYCAGNSDCITANGETCNVPTNECIGGPCMKDSDCSACQTCNSNACAPPAMGSSCLTNGI